MRIRFFHVVLPVLLLLACIRPAHSMDGPLVFGVFPSLTAKRIVETYRPLADALEQSRRRRVAIFIQAGGNELRAFRPCAPRAQEMLRALR
jgi:ABC-type phosphate/phosphonate transport system substrate-binding protein